MANKIILVDTSILIDYYRKTNKENSTWFSLVKLGYDFAVSVITKYEIYSGATRSQIDFWDKVFLSIQVLSFNEISVNIAVKTNASLKLKRKQIDLADLFIAATAIENNLAIATLNKKHFNRINNLQIIE